MDPRELGDPDDEELRIRRGRDFLAGCSKDNQHISLHHSLSHDSHHWQFVFVATVAKNKIPTSSAGESPRALPPKPADVRRFQSLLQKPMPRDVEEQRADDS